MLKNVFRSSIYFFLCMTEEIYSCSTCFTWKVSVNKLTLTCKVDNLHLSIFIDDPFGNVQADCLQPIPAVKCEPYYKNGSITQNPTTKETVFTVQGKIDKSINGNWTCRHGTQRDIAKVEVTVLGMGGGLGSGLNKENWHLKNNTVFLTESNGNQCIFKVMFFSTISYFGAMLLWILLWCIAGEYIKPWNDDIWKKCKCIKSVQVCKALCFFACSCVFLGICAVYGVLDDASCASRIVLPITGVVFGSISTLLCLNLAVVPNTVAENEGTTPVVPNTAVGNEDAALVVRNTVAGNEDTAQVVRNTVAGNEETAQVELDTVAGNEETAQGEQANDHGSQRSDSTSFQAYV